MPVVGGSTANRAFIKVRCIVGGRFPFLARIAGGNLVPDKRLVAEQVIGNAENPTAIGACF